MAGVLILASTTVTVVIIVVAVVIIGGLLVALGPLSKPEQLRDDILADAGPVGSGELSEHTEEEIAEAEGRAPAGDAEERLDRENE